MLIRKSSDSGRAAWAVQGGWVEEGEWVAVASVAEGEVVVAQVLGESGLKESLKESRVVPRACRLLCSSNICRTGRTSRAHPESD